MNTLVSNHNYMFPLEIWSTSKITFAQINNCDGFTCRIGNPSVFHQLHSCWWPIIKKLGLVPNRHPMIKMSWWCKLQSRIQRHDVNIGTRRMAQGDWGAGSVGDWGSVGTLLRHRHILRYGSSVKYQNAIRECWRCWGIYTQHILYKAI